MTVKELVEMVADLAGKRLDIRWIDGPVGVQSRNFSNDRIESLGWSPAHSLRDGIVPTYRWIEEQVRAQILAAEAR